MKTKSSAHTDTTNSAWPCHSFWSVSAGRGNNNAPATGIAGAGDEDHLTLPPSDVERLLQGIGGAGGLKNHVSPDAASVTQYSLHNILFIECDDIIRADLGRDR